MTLPQPKGPMWPGILVPMDLPLLQVKGDPLKTRIPDFQSVVKAEKPLENALDCLIEAFKEVTPPIVHK